MLAGYAMMLLALGALVMVVLTGMGGAEDDHRDDPTAQDVDGDPSSSPRALPARSVTADLSGPTPARRSARRSPRPCHPYP